MLSPARCRPGIEDGGVGEGVGCLNRASSEMLFGQYMGRMIVDRRFDGCRLKVNVHRFPALFHRAGTGRRTNCITLEIKPPILTQEDRREDDMCM